MSATTAKLPPTDTKGEMATASLMLVRFRRELNVKSGLSFEWQRWVAESLLQGCPELPSESLTQE